MEATKVGRWLGGRVGGTYVVSIGSHILRKVYHMLIDNSYDFLFQFIAHWGVSRGISYLNCC
jgi:hypothetical protein